MLIKINILINFYFLHLYFGLGLKNIDCLNYSFVDNIKLHIFFQFKAQLLLILVKLNLILLISLVQLYIYIYNSVNLFV